MGNQYDQNARPRATAFSQSRDCDSCIPARLLLPWASVVTWIEPLLIEAVTDLVQDAEKRVAKMVFIEPSCDPAVTGPDSRTERMSGHVEPAAVEVKSYCRSDRLTKYPLPFAGVIAFEDCLPVSIRGRLPERFLYSYFEMLRDRLDQRNQVVADVLEECGQLGTVRPRLVLVK